MKIFQKNFIKDQLKQVCDDRKVSTRKLSEQINIPYSTLSNYASGSRQPKWDLLQALHTSIGINLAWFVTGEGPMYESQRGSSANEERAVYNVTSERETRLISFIQEWMKNQDESEQAWLEVQLARAVPEYNDYLKSLHSKQPNK